mgnify:CR=1 FL=1
MRIACITYRTWASNIYTNLENVYQNDHTFLIWNCKEEFDSKALIDFNPDLILWYGWSWMVDQLFIDNYESIMLHPSPLPKYRGGSPIQNQIINGEKTSAITLFRMTNELDTGDIYKQLKISLHGSLQEIFTRISDLGFSATCDIFDKNYQLTPQDESKATFYKRKKPKDSEITIEEINTKSADYLYNKIRMLNAPYPNAYIKTADNRKLFIIKSKIEDKTL